MTTQHDDAPPRARVKKSRWPAAVWLLPAAATLVVGWLLVRELFLTGIEVTVTFPTARGLTAAGTPVVHKGVRIGAVTGVTLSDDLEDVHVRVSIDELEAFAKEGASYWVAAPRLDLRSPSDVISGASLAASPGTGPRVDRFVGLDEPPITPPDEPGTVLELVIDDPVRMNGAVQPDSAVLHGGRRVGRVLGVRRVPEGTPTVIAHIAEPFDRAIGPRTVFWRTSAVSIQAGVDDVHFEVASLQSLLTGGVQFGKLPPGVPGRPEGSPVRLYENYVSARDALHGPRARFASRFPAAVGAPSIDAPVTIAGQLVGRVRSSTLALGTEDGRLMVDVVFELDSDRLAFADLRDGLNGDTTALIDTLVAGGLRTRLHRVPMVLGPLQLELVIEPDADDAGLDERFDPPRIPSVSDGGGLQALLSSATGLLESVDTEAVQDIVADVRRSARALRELITAPEIDRSVQRLDRITKAIETAAEDAARAASALHQLAGGNVRPAADIPELVEELTQAAESIRHLAATLARKPEAVIWGR